MRMPLPATTSLVALSALTLTGCAAAAPPSTGAEHADVVAHVHAIVPAPDGDGFLLGTHDGIFSATADGQLGPRVGGTDFDAMGLTALEGDLIASGHSGRNTPDELGEGNLGIIRSQDGGETWDPVAFSGEKDFHALTAGPDGTLYGRDAGDGAVLVSTDRGMSWSPTGSTLLTFGLQVDATGRIIAVTPGGPQLSTDRGKTFTPLTDAPDLLLVAASPDRQRLVGVDKKNTIWTVTGTGSWRDVGSVHSPVQAITITDEGDVLVVDASGLSLLPSPRRDQPERLPNSAHRHDRRCSQRAVAPSTGPQAAGPRQEVSRLPGFVRRLLCDVAEPRKAPLGSGEAAPASVWG